MIPGGPDAPAQSPAQIEASRSLQQTNAPRADGAAPPLRQSYTDQNQVRAGNASAGALAGAVAAHESASASNAAGAESTGGEPKSGRTRGLFMILLGVTGMLGLGLGRVAMNAMSHSNARQAEEALESAPVEDPNVRDLGGDHREYIID